MIYDEIRKVRDDFNNGIKIKFKFKLIKYNILYFEDSSLYIQDEDGEPSDFPFFLEDEGITNNNFIRI